MKVGECWEIIYDSKSAKVSRAYGTIVSITNGIIVEFDNGEAVNLNNMIRGKQFLGSDSNEQ
jgi:hypothetical protein